MLGIPDPRIPQLLSFLRHGHGASERIGGTFVVVETREIDNGQGYSGNHGDSVLVVLMLLRGLFWTVCGQPFMADSTRLLPSSPLPSTTALCQSSVVVTTAKFEFSNAMRASWTC